MFVMEHFCDVIDAMTYVMPVNSRCNETLGKYNVKHSWLCRTEERMLIECIRVGEGVCECSRGKEVTRDLTCPYNE